MLEKLGIRGRVAAPTLSPPEGWKTAVPAAGAGWSEWRKWLATSGTGRAYRSRAARTRTTGLRDHRPRGRGPLSQWLTVFVKCGAENAFAFHFSFAYRDILSVSVSMRPTTKLEAGSPHLPNPRVYERPC